MSPDATRSMSLQATVTTQLTEEQIAAIEARDGSYLLSANAGSGKTTVLVERFVRAHLEDGLPIDSILAITFTEKAALEMRERVAERLRELSLPEWAAVANGAQIATIDGFCTRLLREHCLHAGLPPNFTVLDELAATRLRLDAFDAALSEQEEAAVELLARYKYAGLRKLIFAVYDDLRMAGQLTPSLPQPGPSPEIDSKILALEQATGDRRKELEEELKQAYIDIEATGVVELLQPLLVAFHQQYCYLKQQRAGLDFADLTLRARELLSGDDVLREQIAERYGAILIDEFQDTNPLQVELVELIARDNVFVVGDEFQSIYGFRHAKVTLFKQRRDRLRQSNRASELTANFRSHQELLDGINHTFAGVFAAEGHGDFSPLQAGRSDFELSDEAPIELLLVDVGGSTKTEDGQELEARRVAARIAELVEDGYSYGDIAILLRNRTRMSLLESALRAAGIPVSVVDGSGFFTAIEVSDLVAALSVISNPLNELSLYQVIASPFVGGGSDLLDAVARLKHGEGISACDAAKRVAEIETVEGVSARELARLDITLKCLQQLQVRRLTLPALLDALIIETGYDLEILRSADGKQKLANVRKLQRLADQYQQDFGADLHGFSDFLRQASEDPELAPREPQAQLNDDRSSVSLMTIHQSKGLQFPVVFLCDLGAHRNNSRPSLKVDGQGGIGLQLPLEESGESVDALAFPQLKEQLKMEERLEEQRLYYVAMTRAEEKLLLSATTKLSKPHGNELFYWIGPAVAPGLAKWAESDERETIFEHQFDCRTTRVRCEIVDPELIAADRDDQQLEPLQADDRQITQMIGEITIRRTNAAEVIPRALPQTVQNVSIDRLSYSAIEKFRSCGYRFYLEDVLGLKGQPERFHGGIAANVRGTVVHELLEHLRFDDSDAAPSVALVAEKLSEQGSESEEKTVAELSALVQAFLDSSLYRQISAMENIEQELPFTFLAGEVMIGGQIDLIARSGNEAVIVDYKTDRRLPADLDDHVASRYEPQRVIYALAALESGSSRVSVVHYFMERPEQPVVATYETADLPALKRQLNEWTTTIQQSDFTVASKPHIGLCAACPGRYALCSWESSFTGRSPQEATTPDS